MFTLVNPQNPQSGLGTPLGWNNVFLLLHDKKKEQLTTNPILNDKINKKNSILKNEIEKKKLKSVKGKKYKGSNKKSHWHVIKLSTIVQTCKILTRLFA
jgi:hypothetical protein